MRLLAGLALTVLVAASVLAQECGPGCTSCDKSAKPHLQVITSVAALTAAGVKGMNTDFRHETVLMGYGGKAPAGSTLRFDGTCKDRGVVYVMATLVEGDGDKSVKTDPTFIATVPKDAGKSFCLVVARAKQEKGERESGEVDAGPPQSNSGPFSAITKPRFAVLRSKDEMSKLWAEHNGNKADAPAPPYVDFDKSLVVAYFAGDIARGGVAVVLLPYFDDAGVGHVFAKATQFANPTERIHTQPYAFIEIPRVQVVRCHALAAVR